MSLLPTTLDDSITRKFTTNRTEILDEEGNVSTPASSVL
jgi:hypothetical protein